MTGSTIVFYLLGLMSIVSAVLSVTSRQIFRSAIYLLFTLIGIAGLYFWMDFQFIAAVQIVVYVGGIAVLIIFSIFLTQQSGEQLPEVPVSRAVAGSLAVMAGLALVLVLTDRYGFVGSSDPGPAPSVAAIGEKMLDINGYALPFEVVSILLLAAMVGCIVIAMRKKPQV
ncbi:MAG: NADH-quinone oxidoreductase subunit J [Chitinophagaceae bacterium]